METPPSGTGVFYQAMPAIGADGKRIMKLIPVQMVNGQYVQTHKSKPKAAGTPPSAAMEALRFAPKSPASPSAVQPCISKVSSEKIPSTSEDPGLRFLTKQQTQAVSVLPKVPPTTSFVKTIGDSVQHPNQLPATVKSPALLQILPPNTQMWTVPASQLPQGIKTQFVSSQGTPSPPPGALGMVFVSPGTTTIPAVSPRGQSSIGSVRQISTMGREVPGAKPHLKLIPKISHRPNSPTRWVVEEVGDSLVANGKPSPSNFYQTDQQADAVFKEAYPEFSKNNDIDESALPKRWVIEEEHISPGTSQPVVSETLQVLSGKQRASVQHEAFKDVPSVSSQGQKNALLMCNGKVFLVAQEKKLPCPTRSQMNSYEFHQTLADSSPAAPENGAAAKSQTERRNLGEVDEVIDLCDEEEPPGNTESVSLPDEDNVIFVSYSPPKSQSKGAKVQENPRGSSRGGEPEQSSPAHHPLMTSNQPNILVVDEETESPGDHGPARGTESPGDHRPAREMDSPRDHVPNRETESPGDHGSNRETESPGDHGPNRETESPRNRGPGRETESPGDHGPNREKESPGDHGPKREMESPGDHGPKREMESPGDHGPKREMESPGDHGPNREKESPGDHGPKREMESPGDFVPNRETENPGPGIETENSMNISPCCSHTWTEESLLADARLRRIHGVTADVLVVLQRIDETERGPSCVLENVRRPQEAEVLLSLSTQPLRCWKSPFDRKPAEAFVEPQGVDRSGDAAVEPSVRRLGRTRKRTKCKCCSPEANSGTGVVGPGLSEPPSKKEDGTKDQPCRTHSGLATRSKKNLGNSQDLKHGVPVKTMRRFLHEKLVTTGVS